MNLLHLLGFGTTVALVIFSIGFVLNGDVWTPKKLTVLTGTGTLATGLLIGPMLATYFFLLMVAIIVNFTKYSYDKS